MPLGQFQEIRANKSGLRPTLGNQGRTDYTQKEISHFVT